MMSWKIASQEMSVCPTKALQVIAALILMACLIFVGLVLPPLGIRL
jgi:hypothetical protein